jgi:hypothetical protein
MERARKQMIAAQVALCACHAPGAAGPTQVGKGQEALLLPSNREAKQYARPGGCSCSIQVRSSALQNTG